MNHCEVFICMAKILFFFSVVPPAVLFPLLHFKVFTAEGTRCSTALLPWATTPTTPKHWTDVANDNTTNRKKTKFHHSTWSATASLGLAEVSNFTLECHVLLHDLQCWWFQSILLCNFCLGIGSITEWVEVGHLHFRFGQVDRFVEHFNGFIQITSEINQKVVQLGLTKQYSNL